MPGAAGTWKDLTGNVNLLAANLTTQVRAIAEVATAVTKGDLTRSIQVDARGEVAELKDNINTMIDNLRLTTERNTEQDWLKTNLARFTNMLQGQRDLDHGRPDAAFGIGPSGRPPRTASSIWSMPRGRRSSSFWHPTPTAAVGRPPERPFSLGEGLIGQCALDARSDPDSPPCRRTLFRSGPECSK